MCCDVVYLWSGRVGERETSGEIACRHGEKTPGDKRRIYPGASSLSYLLELFRGITVLSIFLLQL